MQIEKVFFKTEDGLQLFGMLHKPEKETKEVIVAIHGMSSSCMKERDDILAKKFTQKGIAYFCFNNRGVEYMIKIKKTDGDVESKYIGGCIYEDVYESNFDVKAAIEEMLNRGFTDIHLQGHSLGCTKIIYTYNKEILKNIKSVILLSLVDIVGTQKYYLKNNYDKVLEMAIKKQEEGKESELMPKDVFIHPVSVKTYLRYFKYNNEINFAKYEEENYDFKEINNIKVPLFLRWGNVHEMVIQNLDELIKMLKNKIKNPLLDIGYIDGADHGYWNKEEQLAFEIIKFLDSTR